LKTIFTIAVAAIASSAVFVAQERKPVPKDSVRVVIPGCSKDRMFTAGPRTEDSPGRFDIPQGMHVRMNGPKAMMAEIKGQEGSMIEITGLMKKGQYGPDGVGIGGGVRISPGPSPVGGNLAREPNFSQIMIDVEGWRPVLGRCASR
jgi:hypothetical protein